MAYDLSQRTPGERLWLWRLAQPSPTRDGQRLSQTEAADRLGIDRGAYWKVEHDEAQTSYPASAIDLLDEPEFTPALACRLARRRSGLGLTAIVTAAGLGSAPTFYAAEAVGADSLVAFWGQRGFIFP